MSAGLLALFLFILLALGFADKNWLNTPDKIWLRSPGANIELNLPPKISIRLTLGDTEPGTEIKLVGEDLNNQYLHN